MPFATTWVDIEVVIPSEVSQEEQVKYHTVSLMCGIQTVTQMNLFTKQKQTHRHRE